MPCNNNNDNNNIQTYPPHTYTYIIGHYIYICRVHVAILYKL